MPIVCKRDPNSNEWYHGGSKTVSNGTMALRVGFRQDKL